MLGLGQAHQRGQIILIRVIRRASPSYILELAAAVVVAILLMVNPAVQAVVQALVELRQVVLDFLDKETTAVQLPEEPVAAVAALGR
jgi:hypothetical protein